MQKMLWLGNSKLALAEPVIWPARRTRWLFAGTTRLLASAHSDSADDSFDQTIGVLKERVV